MTSKIVFYSWQTDSDKRFNLNFIEDCVKRAIRKLKRDDLSDLIIDRDTKNVPGMPDIGNTILEKIANASVVVADLTLINPAEIRRKDERPTSNPNVLFELGYAYGKLGHQAMIGVFNTAYGDVEELPFDLRPKRLMTYRLKEGVDMAEARRKLVDKLADAIKECIGETEDEQIQLNSEIHDLLTDFWRLGTEIEEWHGIETLPKVLQEYGMAAQKLWELMRKSKYNDSAKNVTSHLHRYIVKAASLALNEENWPQIKQLISSAGVNAGMINDIVRFELDLASQQSVLSKLEAIPVELDFHIESLQNDQYRRFDLEQLGKRLRHMAFYGLIPQHPNFTQGLEKVSLELRRHILNWAKNSPKKDDAIIALQDIREQLAQLVSKYATS